IRTVAWDSHCFWTTRGSKPFSSIPLMCHGSTSTTKTFVDCILFLTLNKLHHLGLNILLTGVGGPTPRSLAYSIRNYSDRFRECRLVATDINPRASGLFESGFFARSYLIPRAGDGEYWESIHRIVESENIDLALIQPEAE